MFDIDKWKEIWVTISRNKTRSVLTAFGVFWGLFMFILLVGFGNGVRKSIMDGFDGFASNSCFFYTDRTSEAYKGYRKGRWWSMNSRDVAIIREKSKTVEYLSPMLQEWGAAVRGNKTRDFNGCGVFIDYFNIQVMKVVHGRLLNNIDIENKRKVCVIGKEVYETLFDVGEDPIGQTVRFKGIYYRVVGVVEPIAENISVGAYPPRTLYLPFTTVQQTISRGDRFWFMGATAKPGYKASMVEEEIKQIVKANHDIAPTDEKAMGSFNIEEQFRQINGLFLGITILVWIVGLGALFSGIIGISNIMLVTVRERMREIGVRRALGAKPLSILTQILSESFVLTAIAGIFGFLIGVAVLAVMEQAFASGGGSDGMAIVPDVSFNLAVTAMVILIIAGLLAGLMPALKALQIKAIDAIRDE